MRIVLLASGSGSLAQSIIDARDSGKLRVEILQLISDKQSQALDRVNAAGISTKFLPMTEVRSIWDEQLFKLVSDLNPDLVVSVGFMRILSGIFVTTFPTINPSWVTSGSLVQNFLLLRRYDDEQNVILTFNKPNNHFTLKNTDKKVSTVRGLAPKKKQGTVKNVVNNDNSLEDTNVSLHNFKCLDFELLS